MDIKTLSACQKVVDALPSGEAILSDSQGDGSCGELGNCLLAPSVRNYLQLPFRGRKPVVSSRDRGIANRHKVARDYLAKPDWLAGVWKL